MAYPWYQSQSDPHNICAIKFQVFFESTVRMLENTEAIAPFTDMA